MPTTMSQVARRGKSSTKQLGELQRQQDSIESEQTSNNRSKKKAAATTKISESGDCKELDSFTLIDAANATAATATGKDLGESRAADPAAAAAKALAKSTTAPANEFSDKFDTTVYHQENEVNNNSIPASESQTLSPSSATNQPAKLHPAQLTPLSLLTGLRMHTSSLKSNQQQQQQQQQSGTAAAADSKDHRKLAIKSDEQQQQQQVNGKLSIANNSPASYVESSLNPQQGPAGNYMNTSSLSPRRLDNTAYIPSYTSIFSNPTKLSSTTPASTSSPSSPDNLDQKASSISHQKQHLLSESTTIRQTTSTNRGSLVKQQATTSSSIAHDLSPRSLFLSNSSRISNNTNSDIQRLPSIFDHSSGRLKEPNDYDDRSNLRRPNRRLLDEDVDDIIDYDDNNCGDDDDHLSGGQDFNSAQVDDEKVTPEPYILSKSGRNLANNLRTSDRSSLIDGKNSISERKRFVAYPSPDSSHSHNQLNYHQTPKYPGSSSKLSAQQVSSERSARAESSLKVKMSQAQQQANSSNQQNNKKLQQQSPQAQHTRITMNEMSRPPSFNTTTCQQQQEHNLKVASCRKLDLLEQVAHLDCNCNICSKGRKLASIHNNDLYHHNSGSRSKLSNFNFSQDEKKYPKTRFVHMVLKSIILVLCTLLLLLLLVGTVLISHYLPQSMEKVMNVSRSFNVTIAGRR